MPRCPQFLLLLLLGLPRMAVTQEKPFIAFDHYHTLAEIEAYLGDRAARFPQLVTLHEIGRSLAGRPISAVDINNPATGPANEKPGFYVDGNTPTTVSGTGRCSHPMALRFSAD